IDQIRCDQIARLHGPCIGEAERRILNRPLERSPEIEDAEPAPQQLVGFLCEQIAHSLRARFARVVVVHAWYRLARYSSRPVEGTRNTAADRVIEYHHASRSGHSPDERDRFGVVPRANQILIAEVPHTARGCQQAESFPVERQVCGDRPHVLDAHRALTIHRSRMGHARRRLEFQRTRLLAARLEVLQTREHARCSLLNCSIHQWALFEGARRDEFSEAGDRSASGFCCECCRVCPLVLRGWNQYAPSTGAAPRLSRARMISNNDNRGTLMYASAPGSPG